MLLHEILNASIMKGASDIIITTGKPAMFRLNGQLVSEGTDNLVAQSAQDLIYSILSEEQKKTFESGNELDLSITLPNSGRFRVNVFRQQGHVGAAFRPIMSKMPTLEELQLPPVAAQFASFPSGLVCITGPTGSGKSTTLAAMVNYINKTRRCHIITIEDPIEFVHTHNLSVIQQREIGRDTSDFKTALKYVLRQCPDVILVGEMRDLETIAAAITIAETGHLVLSTLHTQSAAKTIDRIIDVFPPYQQHQIRAQLASTLKGVLSQILLPRADGKGRVAAREIMVVTPGIGNLIRDEKTFQIPTAIQTGAALGMQSMDQCLNQLRMTGAITQEIYQARLSNPPNPVQTPKAY
ncbi:MAG: type IV pilus twitching motility protein PilT [Candidatus Riflebacteria bacterium]|nr:type IV pilus twitching motility protein PilT [Candidatus Riflebacteria bacterium]